MWNIITLSHKFNAFHFLTLFRTSKWHVHDYVELTESSSILEVFQKIHVENIHLPLLAARKWISSSKLIAFCSNPLHNLLLIVLLIDFAHEFYHFFESKINLARMEISKLITISFRSKILHVVNAFFHLKLMVVMIIVWVWCIFINWCFFSY